MLSTLAFLLISFFLFSDIHQDPPTIAPLEYAEVQITSNFGMRMHPITHVKKLHKGIDIKASHGTAVIAPSDGIIVAADYDESHGYYVEIKHDEIYSTRYHHLSKVSVTKDQKVVKEEKIGEIGSSGLSVAPHLHYEVIENGNNVDPLPFLKP